MEGRPKRYFVFEPDLPVILGLVQPKQLLELKIGLPEILRPFLANRVDPYIGCAFDCPYCIIKDFMRARGQSWGLPSWWLQDLDQNWRRPIVRPRFIERLERELDSVNLPFIRIGTYTDPYQSVEEDLKLTRQILALLLWKVPTTDVLLWTKGTKLPPRDFDLFLSFGDRFRLTLSIDDDPTRSPVNKVRVNLVQEARRQGITAGIALDPWMPDVDPVRVIEQVEPQAAYWIVGGLLDLKGNYPHLDFYRRELPRVIRWMLEHNVIHDIERPLEEAVGLTGYSDNLLSPERVYEWLEERGEKL